MMGRRLEPVWPLTSVVLHFHRKVWHAGPTEVFRRQFNVLAFVIFHLGCGRLVET
jgi:hypothetical protein